MTNRLYKRLLAGMGANSLGMAITIGIQLVSLPLFLAHWDAATYGSWLLISALPAYLSMADVGMVAAAGNRMIMAVGAGKAASANGIFQSAQVFMACVCLGLAVIACPIIWWSPWPQGATDDQRLALMAMSIGVLIALFGGLSEQVFKATQRYATGTLFANLIRVSEWIGSMVGLVLIGSFTAVAFGGLGLRLVGTLVVMVMARKGGHGMTWGFRHSSSEAIRQMLKPAFAFMALPLASALSLQGVTLLVGILLGPVAVAVFNTYRTLARIAVQATAIFSFALWPEFARLFGEGAHSALRQLAIRSAVLSAVQAVLLSAVLYMFAPWLLRVWTHSQIGFEPLVFGVLMTYASMAGIWHVPKVLLMATNLHGELAIWSVLVGALSVVLAWLLGRHMGLVGVSNAMLVSEALIAIICVWIAWRTVLAHTEKIATR